MLAYLAFLPGLSVGMFLTGFVVHWIALLLAALGRDLDGNRVPSSPGRRWPIVLAVVHPVPWLLLIGLPYGIYFLVTQPPPPGWLWFFYGALAGFLGSPLLAIYLVLRNRSQAKRSDNVA